MRLILCLALPLAALMAQAPADDAGSWIERGIASFQQANYPDAAAAFQKAVGRAPENITARLYLATAWFQMYVPGADAPENLAAAAKAETEFRRVLDLDPSNVTAIGSLASLAFHRQKWDEARSWYQGLLSIDSQNKQAYYSLGVLAWSQSYPDFQSARARLGMKPQDPGPIADAGVRQELRDRYGAMLDEGVTNLTHALEIDPQYDDAMAYMNLIVRERADLADTPDQYQIDIRTADDLVERALQTKAQKAAGGERAAPVEPLTKVDPIYPAQAIEARISGIVRLKVVVGKDGHVSNVTLVSGHPLLAQPAMDAVRQWVYRPILAGGVPAETTIQVVVPFALPN